MIRARARPSSLHFDLIAEVALEVLRSEGPNGLSLRRVAEQLDTNHVALYRRCGSIDGLLDLCADYVAAGFPSVPDNVDWAVATQTRFENLYDIWAAHADLIVLMRGRAWMGINMVSRFYEPALRGMMSSGLTIHESAKLFSMLYRLTIGSIIATRANQWSPLVGRQALNKLGLERFPTLQAMIENDADDADARSSFRDALQRLIVDFASRNFGTGRS